MLQRLMIIYYGEDRLPYKDESRQVHYPIVNSTTGGTLITGENNTSKIYFYVNLIGGSELQWIANIKKPDGTLSYQLLTNGQFIELSNGQVDYRVELDIAGMFADQVGDVYIGIQGYGGDTVIVEDDDTYQISGDPIVLGTGAIKIKVNYSPNVLPKGETLSPTVEQLILASLGSKADKSETIFVAPNILTLNKNNFNENQMFLDQETRMFYKLVNNTFQPFQLSIADLFDAYTKAESDAKYVPLTDVSVETTPNKIVKRDTNGQIKVLTNPNANDDAVSKSYADGIRAIAEGKCLSITVDASAIEPTESTFDGSYTLKTLSGEIISTWEQYQEYISSGTFLNPTLGTATGSTNISVSDDEFVITTDATLCVLDKDLGNGDIILVAQRNVPDWWYDYMSDTIYPLETAKVDLTGFVDLTNAQTITGTKTFKNQLKVTSTDGTQTTTVTQENNGSIYVGSNLIAGGGRVATTHLRPISNNTYDLGESSLNWKDLYLKGAIKYENATVMTFEPYSFNTYSFGPLADNAYNVGRNNKRYQNVYTLNISDTNNTVTVADLYSATYGKYVADNTITTLPYETISEISLSADTTFSLKSAPTGCYSIYSAWITNTSSSAITLTFTGVATFITNDEDNVVITNGTNTTISLGAGVTVEISIEKGHGIAVNHNVQ